MTTKYRIILGFFLMMLLATTLGTIGYVGLESSSTIFAENSSRAKLNNAFNDMTSKMYQTVYNLERFFTSYDEDYINDSIEALGNMRFYAEDSLEYIRLPERREKIHDTIKAIEEYVELIEQAHEDATASRELYTDVIIPSMGSVQSAISFMSRKGSQSENIPLLTELNNMWDATANLNSALINYAESISEENGELAVILLEAANMSLEQLGSYD